jgi:SAM-dependent methyltransferase
MALLRDEPKMTEAFRAGKGVGWHEHDPDLFVGTERFFRPNYAAHLVSGWIPALDGVEQKLKSGARVADAGCGHGASTILRAQAYPKSTFFGFDYHGPSVERAREHGTWMIVEPYANDRVEENLNPVGRLFYAASTLVCTGASLAQEVGLALGAQAGEKRLREVVMQGGFTRFCRATQSSFNLVLEARP